MKDKIIIGAFIALMAACVLWIGVAMYRDHQHWKTHVCVQGHNEDVWVAPIYGADGNLIMAGYYTTSFVCDWERDKTPEELKEDE